MGKGSRKFKGSNHLSVQGEASRSKLALNFEAQDLCRSLPILIPNLGLLRLKYKKSWGFHRPIMHMSLILCFELF